MDALIRNHLDKQLPDRQPLMEAIHDIILQQDKTVEAVIEPMMGREMILYKAKGMMKYGLSGVKNYMSLHVLPIYGSATLHEKYKALLPEASFQKGCINFKTAEEVPLKVLKQLFKDCAPIDLAKIREEYLQSKKNKKSK